MPPSHLTGDFPSLPSPGYGGIRSMDQKNLDTQFHCLLNIHLVLLRHLEAHGVIDLSEHIERLYGAFQSADEDADCTALISQTIRWIDEGVHDEPGLNAERP
jgi:hypothetical protein